MDLAEKEKASKIKPLIIKKLKYDANSQDMKLFVNTPIIARKTSKNLNILNNQTGKITKINIEEKEITIKMEDLTEVLLIKFDEFNILFHVAFCITIYKSQGQTYDFNYTIHQWSMLNSREKYVALSRGTKKRFINIIN
jgi:ATP-dependent exoDNAse (exonuclease V) alpha subunit